MGGVALLCCLRLDIAFYSSSLRFCVHTFGDEVVELARMMRSVLVRAMMIPKIAGKDGWLDGIRRYLAHLDNTSLYVSYCMIITFALRSNI